MIIQCENCESKFNLDESLLKEEGSKVRCSQCKHVFNAYPPEQAPIEEPELTDILDEDLEETVALGSPPSLDEKEPEPEAEEEGVDFDRAFEEAMGEEDVEAISIDEIPDLEEEEIDMEEAIDLAASIEEDLIKEDKEDVEKKIPGKPEEEGLPLAAPPKKKPGISKVLIIVLVIIILLVGGGVGIFLFAPDLIPDSLSFLKPVKTQEIQDRGVSRLTFKGVNGSFLQSDKLGQLFVIKGIVINQYPKRRSFILIKGALLDDKSKVVKQKMAYAGNTFPEEQLKDMTLEQIDKGMKNRLGKGKTNLNIKPEGSVPFMIIFEKLPDDLSEFTVEGVSSSPGN